MSEADSNDSNYNKMILFALASGYYYITTRKKRDQEDESEDIRTSYVPIAISAMVIYSLRDEISKTISQDRIFLGVAIAMSNYFMESGGGALKASVLSMGTLILGPAITYEK